MAFILGIDPSGNFQEGKGTTGFCLMDNIGQVVDLSEEKAVEYASAENYWAGIVNTIRENKPKYIVCESYQLYNHKNMKAETQSNSFLETPQLIGAIRLYAYSLDIPVYFQSASEAKTRWSDEILQRKGYLDKGNKWNGQQTNAHKRDAMRHAIHFYRYKLEKVGK